jgi:hypothetical protein
MATIGSLAIKITSDTRDAMRGFVDLERQARKSGKDIESSFGGMTKGSVFGQLGGLGTLLGAAGPAAAIAATATGIAALAESMHSAEIAATKMGLSLQTVQSWTRVLSHSDVEFSAAETAITRMQANISEAAMGSAEAEKKFKALGLASKDLFSMTTEEQARKVLGAIGALPTTTQRAVAELDVFGKGGKSMEGLAVATAGGADKSVNIPLKTASESLANLGEGLHEMWGDTKVFLADMAGIAVWLLEAADTTEEVAAKTYNAALAAEQEAEGRQASALSLKVATDELEKQKEATKVLAFEEKARADALRTKIDLENKIQNTLGGFASGSQARDIALSGKDPEIEAFRKATQELIDAMHQAPDVFGAERVLDVIAEMRGLIAERERIQKKEAENKQWQTDKGKVEDIGKSVRTPLEEYKDTVYELDRLMGRGLDPETAARAVQQAEDKFMKSQPQQPAFSFAGGGAVGSAEFYKVMTKAMYGEGGTSPAKQALEEAKQQTRHLKNIRDAMAEFGGKAQVDMGFADL